MKEETDKRIGPLTNANAQPEMLTRTEKELQG